RRLDEDVELFVAERAQETHDRLAAVARDAHVNALQPGERRMILNGAYLVADDEEARFRDELADVARAHEQDRIDYELNGPRPTRPRWCTSTPSPSIPRISLTCAVSAQLRLPPPRSERSTRSSARSTATQPSPPSPRSSRTPTSSTRSHESTTRCSPRAWRDRTRTSLRSSRVSATATCSSVPRSTGSAAVSRWAFASCGRRTATRRTRPPGASTCAAA